MEELSGLSGLSWAACATVIAVLFYLFMKRRWNDIDEERVKQRRRFNEYVCAVHEWQDAIDEGDVVLAAEHRRRIDEMVKRGWNRDPR